MHAMIKAAIAAAALLAATPVAALTVQNTSAAGMQGANFLRSSAALTGDDSNVQANVVGFGLRTDGQQEFAGDGSGSLGYLTTADRAHPTSEPVFENELPTTYRTPGVTTHYTTTAAAAPQAK
jgi:hypothetical protein